MREILKEKKGIIMDRPDSVGAGGSTTMETL